MEIAGRFLPNSHSWALKNKAGLPFLLPPLLVHWGMKLGWGQATWLTEGWEGKLSLHLKRCPVQEALVIAFLLWQPPNQTQEPGETTKKQEKLF